MGQLSGPSQLEAMRCRGAALALVALLVAVRETGGAKGGVRGAGVLRYGQGSRKWDGNIWDILSSISWRLENTQNLTNSWTTKRFENAQTVVCPTVHLLDQSLSNSPTAGLFCLLLCNVGQLGVKQSNGQCCVQSNNQTVRK